MFKFQSSSNTLPILWKFAMAETKRSLPEKNAKCPTIGRFQMNTNIPGSSVFYPHGLITAHALSHTYSLLTTWKAVSRKAIWPGPFMRCVWLCDLSWWVSAPVFSLISNAERHNKKKKTFIQEAFSCTLHHQRKSNYPHWEVLCVVSVSITQISIKTNTGTDRKETFTSLI